MSKPPAVIMGLGVNGLGIVRSLAPLRLRIFGLYSDRIGEIARHSKYLEDAMEVGSPATDEEIWNALSRLDQQGGARPVLIPTADEYACFISRNQRELIARYEFRSPPTELHGGLLDKRGLAATCRRHDVLIPPSRAPSSLKDVLALDGELQFPVIVKPTNTFSVPFPGKNFVAADPASLKTFFANHPDLIDQTVVQEIVASGDGHIVVAATYSNADGKVEAVYTGRKIRQWRPDYGVMCFGVSELIPEIASTSCRFLDAIGYRGFAHLEFAEDSTSGRFYFLEINTRTCYHNQLFADAGVDLTKIGYCEMSGLDYREFVPEPVEREGIYWIDSTSDIPSAAVKWRRGQIHLGELWRSTRKASSYAVYDRHDLRPSLAMGAHLLRGVVRRYSRNRRSVA